MAVRTKDELMTALREVIGEDTSDEALTLVEDVSDTLDNVAAGISEDEVNRRVAEIEETWRKKYRDRFFASNNEDGEIRDEEEEDEREEKTTYESLFKEEK